MTTNMTPLLERNDQFTHSFTPVPLALPAARVIIVTCLDHRVAPEITLGLKLGDAPVLRNAGGRVTQPVIEEIAYLAFLGARISGGQLPPDTRVEVAVIHHTQCGTGAFADDDFRRRYAERIGADERTLREHAVLDPAATVARDVERVRTAPQVSPRIAVSGHVYDVVTGLVETVVPSAQRAA
jgi:carbonic anhydrase